MSYLFIFWGCWFELVWSNFVPFVQKKATDWSTKKQKVTDCSLQKRDYFISQTNNTKYKQTHKKKINRYRYIIQHSPQVFLHFIAILFLLHWPFFFHFLHFFLVSLSLQPSVVVLVVVVVVVIGVVVVVVVL